MKRGGCFTFIVVVIVLMIMSAGIKIGKFTNSSNRRPTVLSCKVNHVSVTDMGGDVVYECVAPNKIIVQLTKDSLRITIPESKDCCYNAGEE